jgi:hypothetical protein
MAQRLGENLDMPDVPELDFTGALAEIWSQINYAAYHLAYVQVYSHSAALRTNIEILRAQEQDTRNYAQIDVLICRAHLAAFFWHLDHVFEALNTAITRGKREYPAARYFWSYERRLAAIEQQVIRQEIKDYRNMGHQSPAVIGCKWNEVGQFVHHFLPTISGHQPKEDVDLNMRLKQYFEFAANVWLEFAPGDFKEKFPRDFRFPVTVPYLYEGEIPKELNRVPQLEVLVKSSSSEEVDPASVKDAE